MSNKDMSRQTLSRQTHPDRHCPERCVQLREQCPDRHVQIGSGLVWSEARLDPGSGWVGSVSGLGWV